jgi:IS5 family transposase
VESNIHYPTDSGLLNDGARVLTRTMKKIEQKTGGLKKKIRDRKRSVTKRVIAIAHALRHKGPPECRDTRKLITGSDQLLHRSRSGRVSR